MSDIAASWLSHQLSYADSTDATPPRYRNWGFTIYRTHYSPSSDQQWATLISYMHTQAYEWTLRVTELPATDAQFQLIWSLFRLDARSSSSLSGLSMNELRTLYNNPNGGQPVNADLRSHRVFLFADEEVLSDVDDVITIRLDEFKINAVEVDYEEPTGPSNPRVPRRYFGWMPMRAKGVVGLWKELEEREMERIAPGTIGGRHLVVWDADDCVW